MKTYHQNHGPEGNGGEKSKKGSNGSGKSTGPEDGQHPGNGLRSAEDLMGRVVVFLQALKKMAIARLLRQCQFEYGEIRPTNGTKRTVDVTVLGSREVLTMVTRKSYWEDEPEGMRWVKVAVRACLPSGYLVGELDARIAAERINGTGSDERGPEDQHESPANGTGASETDKPEPVKKTEAHRVFMLLMKLRTDPRKKKAPLHTVFEYLVLKGYSGQKAALLCRCSEALISARAKKIEKEFRTPIELLRNYKTDILEMGTSVKGNPKLNKKDGDVFETGDDSAAEPETGEETSEGENPAAREWKDEDGDENE